jgi:hypothetical protein
MKYFKKFDTIDHRRLIDGYLSSDFGTDRGDYAGLYFYIKQKLDDDFDWKHTNNYHDWDLITTMLYRYINLQSKIDNTRKDIPDYENMLQQQKSLERLINFIFKKYELPAIEIMNQFAKRYEWLDDKLDRLVGLEAFRHVAQLF